MTGREKETDTGQLGRRPGRRHRDKGAAGTGEQVSHRCPGEAPRCSYLFRAPMGRAPSKHQAMRDASLR